MIFKRKLKGKTVLVESLSEGAIETMFELFARYYENVSFFQFKKDLLDKEKIILLLSADKKIKGFSTLKSYQLSHGNKKHYVLYSGDTIIDVEFWGTAALTMEFLKNIMMAKLKRPFSPVWWFLISKGYKTYLLLANNFITYYPRFDQGTPQKEAALLTAMGETLFPERFNKDSGVIEFKKDEHERLKGLVAPITDKLIKKNPKIAFFQEKNPLWEEGHELACIGEVSLLLGIRHPLKIFLKNLRRLKAKAFKPVGSTQS